MSYMSVKNANKKKILFIIPPANKLYIRDYYCAFSSKTGYYWPSQDLIVLSGILREKYDLELIDVVIFNRNMKGLFSKISKDKFDLVVFSTGSATLKNDLDFIAQLKEKEPHLRVVASGSLFSSAGMEIMQSSNFIDGLLLDFTNNDLEYFLEKDYSKISNMFFRDESKIVQRRLDKESLFTIPVPFHELFLNKKNRIPFFRNGCFITTITSVGCPYKCSFCSAGNISYRFRKAANILQEIDYIVSNLNIRNIFFASPNFFINQEQGHSLLESMASEKKSKISWVANIRVDILDEELIRLMKRVGCRALFIGIESGSQEILNKYNKGVLLESARRVFKICRKYRISTLAYFILGFPEDDESSVRQTLKILKELTCDYISIGFATPDLGTNFRSQLINSSLCPDNPLDSWDSSSQAYLGNKVFSMQELSQIRRRLYRSFYLRPRWIIRHFSDIGLLDLIKGGKTILKS